MADPIVNFFKSTLVGTYSNTDTSFTIATGDGAKLPDPSTDGAFNLVVFKGTAGVSANAFEIVRVTAKSGDVLTVTREQEGTTALTIDSTVHSIILSATKKTFDDIQTAISNVDLTNITGAESITFDTTGDEVLGIPSGTTAQRPSPASTGYIRFNTDTSYLEYYTGNIWAELSTDNVIPMLAAGANSTAIDALFVEPIVPVEYLVVAGGGGGNYHGGLGSPYYWLGGGGGGGGGYRSSVSGESSGGGASAESALDLDAGTNYTVTVGAGGAGGGTGVMTSGSSSVFSTITSTGGGRGGGDGGANQVGGSGGGAGGFTSTGSAGTANQGYKGKDLQVSGEFYLPGGGGGASQTPTYEGRGGLGVVSSITGASVGRAGGGGSGHSGSKTAYHGGGAGSSTGAAASGTANTGGGGGGAGGTTASGRSGGNGGSGVVILRYPSSYTISVGAGLTATTTTVGANKVTTFTAGTGTISF